MKSEKEYESRDKEDGPQLRIRDLGPRVTEKVVNRGSA